jgi:hypothetical protein
MIVPIGNAKGGVGKVDADQQGTSQTAMRVKASLRVDVTS